MIALSTPTYDPNGCVVLPGVSINNPYSTTRRGTVTATLDGGASVYDTGFSESDQIFTATLPNPSRALLVQLRYLTAYYGQLLMSCELGFFRAILSFTVSNAKVSLNLRVVTRLDA